MNIFKHKPKPTKEEIEKLTAQKLIPVKALDGGVLITDDNRLVKILRIGAINTELMSFREQAQLFEKQERALKTFTFPHQVEIVSQPVDLGEYIKGQEKILESSKNFNRKKLQSSYINYCQSKQRSRQVIRRHRYFIFDEPIKKVSKEGYEDAMFRLDHKTEHVKARFKDLNLPCNDITDLEAAKYFHIFFDYDGAQKRPITTVNVPEIITKEETNHVETEAK